MSATRFVILACSLAALPLASAAAQKDDDRWLRNCQREDRGDDRERACVVQHAGFKATGALDADPGVNGGVSIEAWDRDSVDISIRIEAGARTESDAKELAGDVTVEAKNGRIRVNGPSNHGRDYWSANLVVRVPTRTNLDVVAVNGPIGVSEVSGIMRLRTTNGPVELEKVAGDVRARLQNGPLSVVLAGHEWSGAGLDAESVNGPIMLTIPADYNADLETGTINGPMQSSRPLTVTFQGRMKSRIETRLGNGGAPVRVVTTNGPVTID